MAAATTAPNSSRSGHLSCPRPPHWAEANPIAATAPTPATTQNVTGGRSCPRRTAIAAVAAGSRAMTTAPWLAGGGGGGGEARRGEAREAPPPPPPRPRPAAPTGAGEAGADGSGPVRLKRG